MIKLGRKECERIRKSVERVSALAERLKIRTNVKSLAQTEYMTHANKMDKVILGKSENKKNSKNGRTKNGRIERHMEDSFCFEPWYHIVVKVDGAVGPCCIFNEKSLNVKTASLNEIWHGEWFKNFRTQMQSGELPSWCSICNTSQVEQNNDIKKILKSHQEQNHKKRPINHKNVKRKVK